MACLGSSTCRANMASDSTKRSTTQPPAAGRSQAHAGVRGVNPSPIITLRMSVNDV